MSRSRPVAIGLGLVILVVAAAAATGGFLGARAVRGSYHSATPAARAPSAFVAAGATPSPAGAAPSPAGPAPRQPVRAGVTRQLRQALASPALGSRVRARIVDIASGAVLYDRGGAVAAAPASAAKLLTAAALLAVRAPTDRLRTTVRAGAAGAVVLVGGGDPTLTGAARGRPGSYPGAARITELADQLERADVRPTRIIVDDALFSGPTVSPSWAAEDVPSGYAAPILALVSDGGRTSPAATTRSTQPDLAAGRELAAALGRRGLPVVRGRASSTARVLATVSSAPLAMLIEQMLLESDNVIAECLARQVALTEHQPTSFLGAAAAVRSVLRGLGIDSGAGLVDGSGLAVRDRVSPAVLVAVLRAATRTARLRELLAGLPVAAWSGTLARRYLGSSARTGAGVVRAKTGTLTGVSALAGLVHDRSGALLGFALIADTAPSTPAAEAALDAVAAKLAACGCA